MENEECFQFWTIFQKFSEKRRIKSKQIVFFSSLTQKNQCMKFIGCLELKTFPFWWFGYKLQIQILI